MQFGNHVPGLVVVVGFMLRWTLCYGGLSVSAKHKICEDIRGAHHSVIVVYKLHPDQQEAEDLLQSQRERDIHPEFVGPILSHSGGWVSLCWRYNIRATAVSPTVYYFDQYPVKLERCNKYIGLVHPHLMRTLVLCTKRVIIWRDKCVIKCISTFNICPSGSMLTRSREIGLFGGFPHWGRNNKNVGISFAERLFHKQSCHFLLLS